MILHNNVGDTIIPGDWIVVEPNSKLIVFEYFNITGMFVFNTEEGRDEDHYFVGDRQILDDYQTDEYRRYKDNEFDKWLKGLR